MEAFWLLAGVLSTLAALFVLLPWLRTVPRIGPLPAVSWPLVAGAAAVLAGVVGLYIKFGRPELLTRPGSPAISAVAAAAGNAGSMAAGGSAAAGTSMGSAGATGAAGSMDSAIASLQARLAKGGGSAGDWELLAKSYEFLGRPADAAKARARQLPPLAASAPGMPGAAVAAPAPPPSSPPVLTADSNKLLLQATAARRNKKFPAAAAIYARLAAANQMSADGWADYADTAAALQGNKLAGAPSDYIARSLALDPQHPKALWLLASADEEAGRWNDAIGAWQRLMAVLDPNSSDAKLIAANMQQDAKLAGAAPAVAAPLTSGPASAAAEMSATPGVALSGEVTLASALSAKAAKGATLFIVAKSVDAPGIPVAVYRGMVGAWPVKFTLDDSQAMMPGRNLSSAGRVTVEARISKSGQAMPSSGDLSGTSGVIVPAARQPLQIQIDREVP